MLGTESERVAGTLLQAFGSIAGIVGASDQQLTQALDDNTPIAQSLIVTRSLYRAGLEDRIVREVVDPLSKSLHDFLRLEIGRESDENLIAIFLDRDRGFLALETLAKGTSGELTVALRAVFTMALALDARGLILAHNHPSGSSDPSANDIAETLKIIRAAIPLEIEVVDHLIVGEHVKSMRRGGFL